MEETMERLTYEKPKNRWDGGKHPTKYTSRYTFQEVVARLAAYEDIGLEPEEIEVAKERTDIKFALWVSKAWGLADGRLNEILKAEKDGRLVVLPCKVGNIVFDIQDGTPYATRVLSFSYFGDHWACQTVSSFPDLNMLGERVFLTREEAEAVLKKREEADNDTVR